MDLKAILEKVGGATAHVTELGLEHPEVAQALVMLLQAIVNTKSTK